MQAGQAILSFFTEHQVERPPRAIGNREPQINGDTATTPVIVTSQDGSSQTWIVHFKKVDRYDWRICDLRPAN